MLSCAAKSIQRRSATHARRIVTPCASRSATTISSPQKALAHSSTPRQIARIPTINHTATNHTPSTLLRKSTASFFSSSLNHCSSAVKCFPQTKSLNSSKTRFLTSQKRSELSAVLNRPAAALSHPLRFFSSRSRTVNLSSRTRFNSNNNTFSLGDNHHSFLGQRKLCGSNPGSNSQWQEPTGFTTGVMVINSLVPRKKVPLKTGVRLRRLNWYTCGPTVYSKTHLGHARVFVCIDTMQRILKKGFGIYVHHMMNITDVDDKILKAAQERNIPAQDLSVKYEEEFWADIERLNVEKPQVITRVTDYIPQIISFIQKIIENGFAYVAPSGSVYFDLEKYGAGGILRDVRHNEETLEDPEYLKEKKNPKDFVLWRTAQSVLQWPSPWGWGRPGWHIECSTMIHSIFGESLDVHAGGVDLKFPHHENEIRQCGAHFNNPDHQWVNYFLHIGHLHIEGLKMSKSLKNFITLEQMLSDDYTVNQFRLFCLMSRFHHSSEYTRDRMNDARDLEDKFEQFFMNTFNRLHAMRHEPRICLWRAPETDLFQAFSQAQVAVIKALSDYFDCPSALTHLGTLIKHTNNYFTLMDHTSGKLDAHLVEGVANWIAEILTQWFGLNPSGSQYLRLFSSALRGPTPPSFHSVDIVPILDTLVDFRSQVKEFALSENSKVDLLSLSDKLRDEILPPLGIRIEDQKDKTSHWKVIDVRAQQTQLEEHRKKKQEWEEIEKARRERARLAPEDYFRLSFADRYKSFGPDGIPLTDAEDQPLSKSATKKLRKEQEKQKRLYENYLKEQQDKQNQQK